MAQHVVVTRQVPLLDVLKPRHDVVAVAYQVGVVGAAQRRGEEGDHVDSKVEQLGEAPELRTSFLAYQTRPSSMRCVRDPMRSTLPSGRVKSFRREKKRSPSSQSSSFSTLMMAGAEIIFGRHAGRPVLVCEDDQLAAFCPLALVPLLEEKLVTTLAAQAHPVHPGEAGC